MFRIAMRDSRRGTVGNALRGVPNLPERHGGRSLQALNAVLRKPVQSLSAQRTETKAFWGIWTWPICFIFALPFFCLSRSLRLRETSPP